MKHIQTTVEKKQSDHQKRLIEIEARLMTALGEIKKNHIETAAPKCTVMQENHPKYTLIGKN